jgi:hypothetical protein
MSPPASDQYLRDAQTALGYAAEPTGQYPAAARLMWLERATGLLVAAGVTNHEQPTDLLRFLNGQGYLDVVRDHDRQVDVVKELRSKKALPTGGGSDYEEFAIANAVWLMGEAELGEREIAHGLYFQPISGSTSFWREYGRAMTHLIDGSPYTRKDIKLKGIERYWSAYLDVVAELTSGRDSDECVARAREAFRKRNADRRLPIVGPGFEGHPLEPVRCDFRLEGILTYAHHRYGRYR